MQIIAKYSVKYWIFISQGNICNFYCFLHCEEESDDRWEDEAADEDEDVHEVDGARHSVGLALEKQPLYKDQPKNAAYQQNWTKYHVCVSE